jgi:hypothetical protein
MTVLEASQTVLNLANAYTLLNVGTNIKDDSISATINSISYTLMKLGVSLEDAVEDIEIE